MLILLVVLPGLLPVPVPAKTMARAILDRVRYVCVVCNLAKEGKDEGDAAAIRFTRLGGLGEKEGRVGRRC